MSDIAQQEPEQEGSLIGDAWSFLTNNALGASVGMAAGKVAPALQEATITSFLMGESNLFPKITGVANGLKWADRLLAPLGIIGGSMGLYNDIVGGEDETREDPTRVASAIGNTGSIVAGGATLLEMAGVGAAGALATPALIAAGLGYTMAEGNEYVKENDWLGGNRSATTYIADSVGAEAAELGEAWDHGGLGDILYEGAGVGLEAIGSTAIGAGAALAGGAASIGTGVYDYFFGE